MSTLARDNVSLNTVGTKTGSVDCSRENATENELASLH